MVADGLEMARNSKVPGSLEFIIGNDVRFCFDMQCTVRLSCYHLT